MSILYVSEHLSCVNFDGASKIPVIEKYLLNKGQNWNFTTVGNEIVFVLEGQLRFSFGEFSDRTISKGKMVAVPANYNFSSLAEQNSEIIMMRSHSQYNLCDCFPTENLLMEKKENVEYDLSYLTMNDVVWNLIKSLEFYLRDGLRCFYLLELKVKEFFYLLRGYYTKPDLLKFFYLHLTHDNNFSDFIQKSHHKAKTVQDLADLSNYSLSGFQKRFKRVFGVSAYTWMQEKRSKNILHDINNSTKTLKEISDEYGFSSPSHFNDFCKNHFDATPGKIRKDGVLKLQIDSECPDRPL